MKSIEDTSGLFAQRNAAGGGCAYRLCDVACRSSHGAAWDHAKRSSGREFPQRSIPVVSCMSKREGQTVPQIWDLPLMFWRLPIPWCSAKGRLEHSRFVRESPGRCFLQTMLL